MNISRLYRLYNTFHAYNLISKRRWVVSNKRWWSWHLTMNMTAVLAPDGHPDTMRTMEREELMNGSAIWTRVGGMNKVVMEGMKRCRILDIFSVLCSSFPSPAMQGLQGHYNAITGAAPALCTENWSCWCRGPGRHRDGFIWRYCNHGWVGLHIGTSSWAGTLDQINCVCVLGNCETSQPRFCWEICLPLIILFILHKAANYDNIINCRINRIVHCSILSKWRIVVCISLLYKYKWAPMFSPG